MPKKDNKVVIDTTLAPIQVKDCKQSIHACVTHMIVVPRRMTIEELESPDIYANLSNKFNMGSMRDRLEIESSDGTMLALGLVMSRMGQAVKIKIYTIHDLGEIVANEITFQGYIIRLNPVNSEWAILDEKDGSLVKGEFMEQSHAVTWLQDFFKSTK